MFKSQDREFFYDQLLRASILPESEGLSKLLSYDDYLHESKAFNWILEKALLHKDRRIIEFLLSLGLGVNGLNETEQTALHLAARHNYLEILDSLFDHCKANSRDREGLTHFHVACMAGNVQMVQHFLWNRVDVNAIEARDCFTPLHFAVLYRRVGVVDLLLKHGAKVDACDRYRRTPLHLICRGHSSILPRYCLDSELVILQLLMDVGSDFDLQDRSGNTPLMHVYRENSSKPMHRGEFDSPKILNNEYETIRKRKVEYLLRNKANVRLANEDDETALHIVIRAKGSRRGFSKLHRFDDSINVEVAELLLKHGACVNVKNKRNETPLQIAISLISQETVQLLLSHKASVKDLSFQEDCFRYSSPGLPCFEIIENLLSIIQLLRDKGFQMSLKSNLVVLRFLAPDNERFSCENGHGHDMAYKLKNLLEYGTSENIRNALMNFPSNPNVTSLSEQLSRQRAIQQIHLYLTTMKSYNLFIDDLTRLYLEDKMSNLRKSLLGLFISTEASSLLTDHVELQNEIQLMKRIRLTRQTSLYDTLRKNPRNARCRELSSVLKSGDFSKRLSRCIEVVKAHCAKSLVRRYVCRSAEECLLVLVNVRLPHFCCERICHFLSNDSLVNICSAAAMDEPRSCESIMDQRLNER